MAEAEAEQTPLLPVERSETPVRPKLYPHRWYILMLFSVASCWQCNIYSIWGSISESAKCAFDWTDANIALMPALSCWGYVVMIYPFSVLLQRRGLRFSCLCCFLLMAGIGLAAIKAPNRWTDFLIYFGQSVNAMAGPVASAAAPLISAVWFPPEQRTTSTAIASMANQAGTAVAFLLGPQLVEQLNCTVNPNVNSTGNSSIDPIAAQQRDIRKLFLIEFAVCGIIFLQTLSYFPSKPPTPPCGSAEKSRQNFWSSLKQLCASRQFWLLSGAYAFLSGVQGGWLAVVDDMLETLDISQVAIGWMGFYCVIGSVLGGIVLSRIADHLRRRHKLLIVIVSVVCLACTLWMVLIIEHKLAFNRMQFEASFVMAGALIPAMTPLFYELGCELAYPVCESTATGHITIMSNAFAGVFLLLPFFTDPGLSASVMNWLFVGSTAVALVMVVFVRPNYSRLNVDCDDPVRNSDLTAPGSLNS